MEILENILTPEEVEELSGQEENSRLTIFKSLNGYDKKLYYGRGKTLSPEDYDLVAVGVFVAPSNTQTEIIARAMEKRIKKSINACVLKYQLKIDQRFGLTTPYDKGVENSNIFSIFSVIYVEANEEKLKELRES